MVPHNKMHRGGPIHGEHMFTDSTTGVDSLCTVQYRMESLIPMRQAAGLSAGPMVRVPLKFTLAPTIVKSTSVS